MKVLIIVPAFNEEKNIYRVVESIKSFYPKAGLVVVNDGSSDNTSIEARKAGASVIDLPQNLGIGGAVQTGYIYALRNDYDAAIQIDGDGQHNPQDIVKIIDILERQEADMVIGSRFIEGAGYQSSSVRRVGIAFFSFLVSILCGRHFYDTTSGYRGVNKKGIKLFEWYYPKDYPEVETIVYAHRNGMKIKEIPVCMRERQGGKSSITFIKSVFYMIKVTCVLLLQPSEKVAL